MVSTESPTLYLFNQWYVVSWPRYDWPTFIADDEDRPIPFESYEKANDYGNENLTTEFSVVHLKNGL